MNKRRLDDLAVFGGRPLFETPRPTGQLYSPDRARFLKRLQCIVEGRRYSNGGPMQDELEERLRAFHQVDHIVAFANASFAIVVALAALMLPARRRVVVPSFTYRGLPHLIRWAGGEPGFSEVVPGTHTMGRAEAEAAGAGDAAAILAVNHVNAPADLQGLTDLSRESGVPVVYDSVYAIAARYRDRPFGGSGAAEIFSLHATKLLNGFEGGYLATNDASFAEELRARRNFGFDQEQPQVRFLGMNGKMNEVHAAMALGSLEQVDEILARNTTVHAEYRDAIAGIPGLRLVEPAPDMESNHEMVLVDVLPDAALDRNALIRLAQAEGVLCRPYFSPPLHRSSYCPAGVERPDLPVTEALATRFLQLPTGSRLQPGDTSRIGQLLRFAAEHGTGIARRLDPPEQRSQTYA